MDYLQKCKDYHDQWLIYRPIDFKLLRIDTNQDVEYNLTNTKDFGAQWLFLINEFIGEFIEGDRDDLSKFEI